MLLPELNLAEIAAPTPAEALQPAEPSTLVLALIGLGTLLLYRLIARNSVTKRQAIGGSGDVVVPTEKREKRAA